MDSKQTVTGYSSAYFIDISHNNDRLFLDEQVNYFYTNSNEEVPAPPGLKESETDQNTYTWLFTDRSIYRPGQTVFLKGISIVTDKTRKKTVRNNFKTRVYLLNANYQRIDSLDVQTNDFGTFSGKFQLPQGVLNGQFTIQRSFQQILHLMANADGA